MVAMMPPLMRLSWLLSMKTKMMQATKMLTKVILFLYHYFVFITMRLTFVFFLLGNVNEEENNNAIISDAAGGNEDVDNSSK